MYIGNEALWHATRNQEIVSATRGRRGGTHFGPYRISGKDLGPATPLDPVPRAHYRARPPSFTDFVRPPKSAVGGFTRQAATCVHVYSVLASATRGRLLLSQVSQCKI